MGFHSVKLSGSQLGKAILIDFAAAVDNKKYTKVDYKHWRNFKNLSADVNYTVELFKSSNIICICRGEDVLFEFHNQDESLGQFLMKRFFNNISTIENKKENKNMFNFDFGPVSSKIRMSIYGPTICNMNGEWVAYDSKSKSLMNVEALKFDAHRFLFAMPVALKDVAVADVIMHNHVPMFVTKINDNSLTVIDPYAGEEKNILPVKNMFNFNFVTKVVSLFNMGNASEDKPFGNMLLPLMLMNDENGADMDNMSMLAMMAMTGNNFDMTSNPMIGMLMLNALNGNDSGNSIMPMMMAMQFMQQNAAPAATAPAAVAENKE